MNIEENQSDNSTVEDAPGAAVNDAPGGAADDWQAGLDDETRALIALKGWQAPGDALKSYRHLERMVGADKIALPGEDAAPEAWAEIWNKLGRPQSPEGYALQPPANMSYDPKAADWFRQQAHALGLTSAQARGLHDAYLANFGAAFSPAEKPAEAPTDETPDAETDLRRTWGRNYQTNISAARRAVAAFMDGEGEFNDLSDALGDAKLMHFLARVGSAIGEDSITARDSGGILRSQEGALAEIQRLQREVLANPRHPYISKMHPEHDSTVRRMEALFQTAYGG